MAELGSGIGRKLRELREAAGLTQTEAALGLQVALQTISRWELEKRRIKAEDYGRAEAFYSDAIKRRNMRVHGFNQTVPRGTGLAGVSEPPSKYESDSLQLMLIRLERELVRQGATDAEVDFARATVMNSEAIALITEAAGGAVIEAQMREFQVLVDDVRALVLERIARRAKPSPKPIKPSDLPALQEERLRELGVERAKKRSTK